ncbi:MAG: phage major capsid protein, partial [Rhodanobacter sp.]
MRFGGAPPTRIFAGQAFIEALEAENRAISHLNVTMNNSGSGTSYDGGVATTKFDGIPVTWDPTFELVDARYSPATPYTKRAYM